MPYERHFVAQDKYGTLYRLRPNPHAPIEEGYRGGAVLDINEDGKDWTRELFIEASVLKDLGELFAEAHISTSAAP